MWEVKVKKHKDLPIYLRKDIGKIIELSNWKAERFNRKCYVELIKHYNIETKIKKCKACGHESRKQVKKYSR